MKKSNVKGIALFSTILMLLSIFCGPVLAEVTSVNSADKVVLAKESDQYLIYYKDLCGESFEFALAADSTTNVNDLNFRHSAQDQTDGDNIAYIDNSNRSEFGTGTQGYIWIKNSNDQLVVTADAINLSNALTNEQLELVSTTTERIEIDSTQVDESKTTVDGVERTITKGKAVIINPNTAADYSYAIVIANDTTSNAGKLYELAEQLKSATTTYDSLKISKDFYDLYSQLVPSSWDNEVGEDYTVLQPDNTVDGDKYILWLKEDSVIDAHFLISKNLETEGTNTVEKQVTETVKLPVTFDSGSILFTILAVIVIALIVFVVLRKKQNKEEN